MDEIEPVVDVSGIAAHISLVRRDDEMGYPGQLSNDTLQLEFHLSPLSPAYGVCRKAARARSVSGTCDQSYRPWERVENQGVMEFKGGAWTFTVSPAVGRGASPAHGVCCKAARARFASGTCDQSYRPWKRVGYQCGMGIAGAWTFTVSPAVARGVGGAGAGAASPARAIQGDPGDPGIGG
jgi:hypothetical protein